MKKIIYILVAILVITRAVTNAQTLDNTFGAGTIYYPSDLGGPSVSPITLQPDGKILIGGIFTSIGGSMRNFIARLNQDGSIDQSFDPGTGPQWFCSAIVLQPDDRIIIGGAFTAYNQTSINYIARLHPNGSLDASFNPGTGPNDFLDAVVLQPDGKIIIGGRFTSYNGKSQNYVARLHPDGSLDTTFNNQGEVGSGADFYVFSIALQTDGKIIIGGLFSTYNGTSRKGIARLNPDGSLDNSFNPGLGGSLVGKVLIQPDGKILAGGEISYNDTIYHQCMRFNQNGSVDTTFVRGKVKGFSAIARPAAIQQDGKIFVGGWFSSYNDTPRNGIVRLNPDGSVDTTFNPGKGAEAENSVGAITLQHDGKILIGGGFTSYNGIKIDNIARLTNNSSNVSDIGPVEQPLAALFPVPTRENIFVTTEGQIAQRIDVMNLLGQTVARVEPSSLQTEISLLNQPKGMYFVTVTMKNNRQTFKLVKGLKY